MSDGVALGDLQGMSVSELGDATARVEVQCAGGNATFTVPKHMQVPFAAMAEEAVLRGGE